MTTTKTAVAAMLLLRTEWLTVEALAHELKSSRSTMQRCMDELGELGVVKQREGKARGSRSQTPTEFALTRQWGGTQ